MRQKSKIGRCFVSGGAGFIGSHLVDRLMSEGNKVTVYDNLTSGKSEFIKHHFGADGFQFIEADLLDLKTLMEAIKDHDVVFHLVLYGMTRGWPGYPRNFIG